LKRNLKIALQISMGPFLLNMPKISYLKKKSMLIRGKLIRYPTLHICPFHPSTCTYSWYNPLLLRSSPFSFSLHFVAVLLTTLLTHSATMVDQHRKHRFYKILSRFGNPSLQRHNHFHNVNPNLIHLPKSSQDHKTTTKARTVEVI
jgi:hypothetical protein